MSGTSMLALFRITPGRTAAPRRCRCGSALNPKRIRLCSEANGGACCDILTGYNFARFGIDPMGAIACRLVRQREANRLASILFVDQKVAVLVAQAPRLCAGDNI